MAELEQIRAELHSLKNDNLTEIYKKDSPYNFYRIRVPLLRKIAKNYSKNIDFNKAVFIFNELWNSGNHEEMSFALFLMQNYRKNFNFEMWKILTKEEILQKLKTIDHIDYLAEILGNILLNNIYLTTQIKSFSQDKNPLIRRLSIMSLKVLIKNNKLELLKLLAEKLAYDDSVYVQKATGYMLKEAAKKDSVGIRDFIMFHRNMKLICLNYALANMPQAKKEIKEKLKTENLRKKKENSLEKIKYFQ